MRGTLRGKSLVGPLLGGALLALGWACGDSNSNNFVEPPATTDGGAGGTDGGGILIVGDGSNELPPCKGIACQRVACAGGASTTITGTVFDPSGSLPIYNAVVYVPNAKVGPLAAGASCERCGASLTGEPLSAELSDATGRFVLKNVPAGKDIPLVIQVGKWRRQVVIPEVTACAETKVQADVSRLPRNRNEGDIPRIALSTGAADPLECLLRKMKLDDAEFGIAGSESRVHLYAGYGYNDGQAREASKKFAPNFAGGASFTEASTLWASTDSLKRYDLVMLACEGTENEDKKPAAARQALHDYLGLGGRVFATHYHSYWFSASPDAAVRGTATWNTLQPNPPDPAQADLVVGFSKGQALKDWLQGQGVLSAQGQLPVAQGRHDVEGAGNGAQPWITLKNSKAGDRVATQFMSFNVPVGATTENACGRAVFNDLHISSGDQAGKEFPAGCNAQAFTPQERALAFLFFDLSSCVQSDFEPPRPPR